MIKDYFKNQVKPLIKDKAALASVIALVVFGVLFIAYFSFRINPVDSQVSIFYTSYGATHFYSGDWVNLLPIILYGLIFVIIHPMIAVKLFDTRGRGSTMLFSTVSILILFISAVLLHRIVVVSLLV